MSMSDVFCPIDEWGDTKKLCLKHMIYHTVDHPCYKCEDGVGETPQREEAVDDNSSQLQIYGHR